MLNSLFVYILISLGFSYMWSFSEIFRPVRNFVAKIPIIKKPLICPDCSSFWFGLFVSLFIYNPLTFINPWLSPLICGLVTHLCASILYKKVL